ncbi:hypothetical protein MAM1_0108c05474 [Mucor ambiguus]|uniref:Uncharacterized protein n=1 Tax=Mucor ambiguus TaxID=91626 RepID=A0A0C9MV41_9FUNG|nr:hypothetical protein MAM1_0108c05474 [Mucor ambiguus]
MEQVQHSLSRLALARAIKSTDNESEEEAWNKSIIFNQPFVKDLHRQKHQLARQLEKTAPPPPQDSRHASPNRNFKRHNHRQYKTSSSSGSSLSLTLEKRPLAPKSIRQSQRTCLPSDTEEDDNDFDDDQAEDDETDDGSEVFQGNITSQMSRGSMVGKLTQIHIVKRQMDPIKKSRSPLLNQNGISRPVSMESSSRIESGVSSPSRNSTSSHVTPLTEEDDVEEPIIHHSQQKIPQHALNEEFPNYIPMQHMPKIPPAPSTPPVMMDPMYYQRLQHYQTQLQYQQQMQYQQQLQYQQQQLYLLSQSPSVFFPSGSRAMMTADEPAPLGPPPPPPPHHMPSSSSSYKRMTHHHHKHRHISSNSSRLSSTDIRRRQEMLKSSATDLTYPSSASLSMYNMASMPMVPSVPRNSGGRYPSYF